MIKVPKEVPRGTFTKGKVFRDIRTGLLRPYRKRLEKEARQLVTDKVNQFKGSISKIVVTDDGIKIYDNNENIVLDI
ncbi:hypothetical protein DC081_08950 [Ignatzschineria cameli]|uniref:hypothetical protein n=1 Tax=Ignatzschineria cameli TaxID=2182793 RepID=UPI000D61ABC7|nr:hypothetical protein [Ignatzschineria cameli]PWD89567.1 hypothetical protein DC081_08950 [Ignatzschineria cameli]